MHSDERLMPDEPARKPAANHRATSLITLVLLPALFILLALISLRYSFVHDWTRSGRHTLTGASIAVLDNIDGPVSVVSYAREQGNLRLAIERFVDRFQRVKPDITLQFKNPDSVPEEIRELGVNVNGELVIHYRDRTAHVREANENTFINALIRLTREDERWIAFIEGHGERNPLGKANHDLGDFGHRLAERGYRVQPINLAGISVIPDNAALLVVAGPRVPLLPGETAMLLRYLQHGGNLLWLLDPGETGFTNELADYLGIDIRPGTIIDAGGRLLGIDDPTIVMLTASLYGTHPLLKDFTLTTLFPRATALAGPDGGEWQVTPLLTTATHTWLESGAIDENSVFDRDTESQGPLSIALALERTPATGNARQKIAVVADGDFLSNRFLENAGNLDLGLRIVNWLADDEDLLTIPARVAADTQLTASPAVVGGIGIAFLLVLPAICIAIGMSIGWRRKRR